MRTPAVHARPRPFTSIGLAAMLAATFTALTPLVAQSPGGGATSSQINAELEQAKQATSQRRYTDAIAKAESALAKLRVLAAQAPSPARDLAVLTIFGDGDAGVSVVIKNMGNVPSGAPVMLYMLPAGGGNPVPLTTISLPLSSPNPLAAGETRTVRSRPFGCGTSQRVKAKVDPNNAIAETNEANNESQVIEVRARPCGS